MCIGELKRRLELAHFIVQDIADDGLGISLVLDEREKKDPSTIMDAWMQWMKRPKTGVMLNVVTAVSRPGHLARIYSSMDQALMGTPIDVQWILVFDAPGHIEPDIVDMMVKSPRIKILKAVYGGGPMRFGIMQKNMGMDLMTEGFYHCLDDDNIVHPNFFKGIHHAIMSNPGKRAFAFGQKRWDDVGDLVANPDKMLPRHIDNTMFIVHKDLIGTDRYEVKYSGGEDFYFFRMLYDKDPGTFVFLDQCLAYYNYLRHFPG